MDEIKGEEKNNDVDQVDAVSRLKRISSVIGNLAHPL